MKNGHGDPKASLPGSPQTGIPQRDISITNAFNFGSFRLLPAQRLLLKDDKVIHLGSRCSSQRRPTNLLKFGTVHSV
jgi:hypothetical protein